MSKEHQKQKMHTATRSLCYTALAVAAICVCAWIAVPCGGVPVTLQSLAICLFAALLGAKRAFVAVAAYLVLGAIGVPVFSGFTGGFMCFIMPSGGYLLGFLLLAPIVGWLANNTRRNFGTILFGMGIGMLICYTCAMLWCALFVESMRGFAFVTLFSVYVLPYLIPDFCKIMLAAFLCKKLRGKIL